MAKEIIEVINGIEIEEVINESYQGDSQFHKFLNYFLDKGYSYIKCKNGAMSLKFLIENWGDIELYESKLLDDAIATYRAF